MDNSKKNMITKEGLNKLEEELYDRENVQLIQINEMIKEAKAQGDLSENAEYEAALEAKRKNDDRIAELHQILANCVVTSDEDFAEDEVGLGKKVTIINVADNRERSFIIVGTQEAAITKDKISNESPIGNALMRHKVGETVEVDTPRGKAEYKIIAIAKA